MIAVGIRFQICGAAGGGVAGEETAAAVAEYGILFHLTSGSSSLSNPLNGILKPIFSPTLYLLSIVRKAVSTLNGTIIRSQRAMVMAKF